LGVNLRGGKGEKKSSTNERTRRGKKKKKNRKKRNEGEKKNSCDSFEVSLCKGVKDEGTGLR